jgi:hypothetical protein
LEKVLCLWRHRYILFFQMVEKSKKQKNENFTNITTPHLTTREIDHKRYKQKEDAFCAAFVDQNQKGDCLSRSVLLNEINSPRNDEKLNFNIELEEYGET